MGSGNKYPRPVVQCIIKRFVNIKQYFHSKNSDTFIYSSEFSTINTCDDYREIDMSWKIVNIDKLKLVLKCKTVLLMLVS